jgi:DNA processing protein
MSTSEAREDLFFSYWLATVPGVGPVAFRRLVTHFGSARAVAEARRETLVAALAGARPPYPRLPEAILQASGRLDEARRAFDRAVSRMDQVGGRILRWDDPAYPPFLRQQESVAPPLLFVRGRLDVAVLPGVAIVGTRAPSPYAASRAEVFGRAAAEAGWAVVSGLAKGIDGQAHRGALRVTGATIAALGCGVDRAYPAEHRELLEEVARRGLVLSTYPPGTAPSPDNLRKRNQLIAGLSQAMVVVEGGLTSGALIAARFAQEQGKALFGLRPADVRASRSEGIVKLLAEGARPIGDVEELTAALAALRDATAGPPTARAPAAPRPRIDAEEQSLLEKALGRLRRHWLRQADALLVGEGGGDLPATLARLRGSGWARSDGDRFQALLAEARSADPAGAPRARRRLHDFVARAIDEVRDRLLVTQVQSRQVLRSRGITAVLFDLDGVLVDTSRLYRSVYLGLFKKRDRRPPAASVLQAWLRQSPRQVVGEQFPAEKEAVLAEFDLLFSRLLPRWAREFPGVSDLLVRLRAAGIRLGIITSQPRRRAELLIRLVAQRDLVETLVTWGDTARHKPDPDPVLRALGSLGTEAERSLYVGDQPVDMACAQAAGVSGVAALWGALTPLDELLVAGPAYVLTLPQDLLALVEGGSPPAQQEGGDAPDAL